MTRVVVIVNSTTALEEKWTSIGKRKGIGNF